jgi:GNAT superfamily N-acetyltransferase
MVKCMSALESTLDKEGLYERVIRRSGLKTRVEIMDYESSCKKHFKSLNYEWLTDLFTIEPEDEKLLSDPRGMVINRGGAIVFAVHDKAVVGTCALIKHDDETYELAKMAVTKSRRGGGIGRLLADAIISRAKAAGCKTLVLFTSDALKPAIALYESLGFVLSSDRLELSAKYDRCTISMQMQLVPKTRSPHTP